MKFEVVTTCHAKGSELYGRRMAKTFAMYWPGINLHVYTEGFELGGPLPRPHQHELPEWQREFKRRWANDPMANGRGGESKYDLLHDAVRFSHKVGAVVDAAETMMGFNACLAPLADVLIWLDADVVTHAPVTREFLEGLVPDWPSKAIAWLNRVKKYPECGFVMFNLHHPMLPGLLTTWKSFYTIDRFKELGGGWTDCHTLQAAVSEVAAPWASLSGRYTNVGHPFINGPLGAVMDHLKGDRKQLGHSRSHDLRAKRKEHYWRFTR